MYPQMHKFAFASNQATECIIWLSSTFTRKITILKAAFAINKKKYLLDFVYNYLHPPPLPPPALSSFPIFPLILFIFVCIKTVSITMSCNKLQQVLFVLVISQLRFISYVEMFDPYTMQPICDNERAVLDYRENILTSIWWKSSENHWTFSPLLIYH